MLSVGARIKHPSFGEGVITGEDKSLWYIFFRDGDKEISKSFEGFDILELGFTEPEENDPLSLEDVEDALKNVLLELSDITHICELGERWVGGTITLNPKNSQLQSKEIPMDTFWHKIVMIRDRMRVLEQNINSHKSLTEEEKIQLQQYITRCYGSLTTFNVLFAEKEDQFKGSGK